MLFDAIDLGATFVFAISGATQGVRHRLDLFGVLVVAWAAAVAGGLARDLLIGVVPPAAIAAGGTTPINRSRARPPATAAAQATTRTPNRSRRWRTPWVAPLMAKTKVAPRSIASNNMA